MNKKFKLTPKEAERLQNEIYRKMPPAKKLEIAFRLISLAKKLNAAKEIKIKSKRK